MSERGTFVLDRGWFDHPCFKREPFTEREAWVWLIAQAAYLPHQRRFGTFQIKLDRGQAANSLRFMADKWQWREARVRRFLARLKSNAMIDTATDAGLTVITIRNYDKYQRPAVRADAPNDAATDTLATRHRRKEERREGRESKNSVVFENFWKAYPGRDGANPKEPARKLFFAAVASGVDPEQIVSAAGRYADELKSKGQNGTPYVAQAKTWLNQRRWTDYPTPTPAITEPDAPVDLRWGPARARLIKALGADVFASWFRNVAFVSIEGELVRMAAPTKFIKGWIEKNYAEKLLAAWQAERGEIQSVELAVVPALPAGGIAT